MNKQTADKRYIIKKSNILRDDITSVVEIHRKEISQGFLSSLGCKPLHMFFSFIPVSKHGLLHVAKTSVKHETVGFVLGTLDTAAFYREFLMKRSINAFILIAPKLMSFENLRKVVETLIYPKRNISSKMPKAELLDIAVIKEHQGLGLAHFLFQAFADTLRDLKVGEFKVTTGASLTRAQRFYERLGAKKVGEFEVHKGQKTCIYKCKV
jgi:ribosomal protein S18 acetylase RimI-like enzyme